MATTAKSGVSWQASGWDCGNGFSKLVTADSVITIPSYFYYSSKTNHQYESLGMGSVLEYLEGDSELLSGNPTVWLLGETAQTEAPRAYRRISDSLDNKVVINLPMLLGAIALTPYQKVHHLSIAASLDDSFSFGADLKKALQGTHIVRLNSKVREINLNVNVCDEGVGALTFVKDSSHRRTATIDFGFGTTIVTVYEGIKPLRDGRRVFNVGVHQLVDAIANNSKTRLQLRKQGSPHLINAGFKRDFLYGTTQWSFKEVYIEELKPWMQSCLIPALKFLQNWIDELDALYAIGGGSNLPFMTDLLRSKRIVVTPDAQTMNAKGLFKLSEYLLSGAAA